MNKIKSNPSQTILVIIVVLSIIYFFIKINFLLNLILVLSLIGVCSKYLSKKIEFLWFKLAYIFGLIIPKIVLMLIFYLFLFPFALLSRIKSKDTLSLINKSKTLYKDVNKSFDKESFKKIW